MDLQKEAQIAFNIWELLSQLEVLLRDRYFDEFNEIIYRLEAHLNKEQNEIDVKEQLDNIDNFF